MSKIGFLKFVNGNGKREFHGEINTLQIQLRIKLIPNHLKSSNDAPDYLIVSPGASGQDVQIGAAWQKTKAQIGDVDFEFITLTIDDPSMPTPLNVAAFQNQSGDWDITFRRRQAA